MTYAEKLKDPRWQKKKGDILARDKHTCRSCGRTDITLHAHHTFYVPNTEPWDYNDDAIVTYCEICHNTQHLIGNVLQDYLLTLIKENPLMIHMVAQLCVLTEKIPEFEVALRKFLDKQMAFYYGLRKEKNGEEPES